MEKTKRTYVRPVQVLTEEERAIYAKQILDLRVKYGITQQMLATEIETSRKPIIMAQRAEIKSVTPYKRILAGIKRIATRQELAAISA